MKLNEHAEAWIAALESGEFEQGNGYLKNDDSFCCMGVACELYRREHPETSRWDDDGFVVDNPTDRNDAFLPASVQEWLGINSNDGEYQDDGFAECLTGDNDGGKTFEQIAVIIRHRADQLFGEKP